MRGPIAAITLISAAMLLAGCGQYGRLVRPSDQAGPPVPAGEARPPTTEEQTTPSAQSRPRRSDEVLRQSQEREADEFDLPPS